MNSNYWGTEEELNSMRNAKTKIGSNCNFSKKANIDTTGTIEIGDNVTLTIEVFILTHDSSPKIVGIQSREGSVKIGNNVFIGMKSTILMGV
jgi:acetyltransferase-like isoleucine patch superfamily enzyme